MLETVSVPKVTWFPDVASCCTGLPVIFACVVGCVGDVALWGNPVCGTCSSSVCGSVVKSLFAKAVRSAGQRLVPCLHCFNKCLNPSSDTQLGQHTPTSNNLCVLLHLLAAVVIT